MRNKGQLVLEQGSDLAQCACAGSNPKGIFNQVKDAVKLKPDIGFDIIAAAYVSFQLLSKLATPFIMVCKFSASNALLLPQSQLRDVKGLIISHHFCERDALY